MLLSLYNGLRSAALSHRVMSLRNDRGASAVEYGLLVALIAVVIVGAIGVLGENLLDIFEQIAAEIADAT